jgi:hypothetical protein
MQKGRLWRGSQLRATMPAAKVVDQIEAALSAAAVALPATLSGRHDRRSRASREHASAVPEAEIQAQERPIR